MDALPDGSPLLANIGEKFQSVGLCNEGVTAFLKAGDTKRAIDCCVLLNQWDQGVQLAQVSAGPSDVLPPFAGPVPDDGSEGMAQGLKPPLMCPSGVPCRCSRTDMCQL